MQALQRLRQKQINMEVTFQPLKLKLKSEELSPEGEPCSLMVKVLRGPLTWQTKPVQVIPGETEIEFGQEEMKKQSGFYFTKDGVEFKKATIQVLKMVAEREEVLSSNDINLSNLISKTLKDSKLEIGAKGLQALDFGAQVYPATEADVEFIDTYLNNPENQLPTLQTPSGQMKSRGIRDLFGKETTAMTDQDKV